ncbi:MAG TPA: hypothetical protein VMW74_07490 [Nitrosopumilaceae archaeon]|nr:hypothetical protein [Nitrosopumilaceae archaeon]
MNKLILSVGLVLIALGVGFLAVASTDYNLSSAYTTGGYLWLVIGAVTSGLGFKVKRSKHQLLGAMR